MLGAAIGIFAFAVQPAQAGQGFSSTGTNADPPLTLFASHTLASPFGPIQAVVYDGNERVIGATNTTTITGFTVPAPPFTAKTTYVVADGQCGATSANGCFSTTPTAGSTDLLRFIGSAATLSNGPDAFKGSDGCPWGIPPFGGDTCLWDTRTFDVTGTLMTGDTSADVEVEAGGGVGGGDCLNHETQVFAVGPTAAWLLAGYQTDGVGLRNQGIGTLTIVGVPPGTQVVAAYLYWNILNNTNPGGAMMVNGTSTPGTMFEEGDDPCWGNTSSWAFRADVTALVSPTGGNGAYIVSGYPTGSVTGTSPWLPGDSPSPDMEGATLAVFYEACPNDDDGDDDGLEDRDENFFGNLFDDDDSDDDGITDGNDDGDDDGEDDEDEDDGRGECPSDGDDDGEDDEDEDDDEEEDD